MLDDLYEIARDPEPGRDPPDLLLRVHVQPGAGRSAVMGRHGDALKVKVGAPPDGGRANAALLGLVASILGIPESRVTLHSGASSRSKRLRIAGVEGAELGRLLELAVAGGGSQRGNARGARGVARHAP